MATFNELLYGDPAEVATAIAEGPLDEGEVRAVLTNLLTRVSRLEADIRKLGAPRQPDAIDREEIEADLVL